MRGLPTSYQVHIWYRKTRMAGLQYGEGRTMMDSVVWAQHINVTDSQTTTQPCRDGNICLNALCLGGEKQIVKRSVTTHSSKRKVGSDCDNVLGCWTSCLEHFAGGYNDIAVTPYFPSSTKNLAFQEIIPGHDHVLTL